MLRCFLHQESWISSLLQFKKKSSALYNVTKIISHKILQKGSFFQAKRSWSSFWMENATEGVLVKQQRAALWNSPRFFPCTSAEGSTWDSRAKEAAKPAETLGSAVSWMGTWARFGPDTAPPRLAALGICKIAQKGYLLIANCTKTFLVQQSPQFSTIF